MTGDTKHTIFFALVYEGKEHAVRAAPGQYYSLMELISSVLEIDGFGLCSGMGSCGTCSVIIRENRSTAERFALACDTMVDDGLANTVVTVPSAF